MRRYSCRQSKPLSQVSNPWPRKYLPLVVALLMVLVAAGAWGNTLEFEEGDTLPRIENFLFTASSVGIISKDGRHFVLDRHTEDLQQVETQSFGQHFPGPWPPKPYESFPTKDVLRSSTGEEFELTPAYCDEGANRPHELQYQQRPFPDVLKPCTSVAALEIIGPHLWLGTIREEEPGPASGEGIVVQLLGKKQKVRTITGKSGLTGGQIRVLRDDPFTKTVWVATEWGLNQIDRQFRVIWGRYWHEDFEPSSQKSQIFLSASRKASNPFAVLSRDLAVKDWTAFSRAIEQISPVVQNKFRLYEFHMSGFPPRALSSKMNGLVPFFIDAAQSETPMVHDFGLRNLCKFDDSRVQTFMAALASKTVAQSADERYVQECLKAWSTRVP